MRKKNLLRWDFLVLIAALLLALTGGLRSLHQNLGFVNFLLPQDYRMFSQIPDSEIWVIYELRDSNGKLIERWDTRNIKQLEKGRAIHHAYLMRYHALDYAFEEWFYGKHNGTIEKGFLEHISDKDSELRFIENLRNLGRYLAKSDVALENGQISMQVWRNARSNPIQHKERFSEWVGKQLMIRETIQY